MGLPWRRGCSARSRLVLRYKRILLHDDLQQMDNPAVADICDIHGTRLLSCEGIGGGLVSVAPARAVKNSTVHSGDSLPTTRVRNLCLMKRYPGLMVDQVHELSIKRSLWQAGRQAGHLLAPKSPRKSPRCCDETAPHLQHTSGLMNELHAAGPGRDPWVAVSNRRLSRQTKPVSVSAPRGDTCMIAGARVGNHQTTRAKSQDSPFRPPTHSLMPLSAQRLPIPE